MSRNKVLVLYFKEGVSLCQYSLLTQCRESKIAHYDDDCVVYLLNTQERAYTSIICFIYETNFALTLSGIKSMINCYVLLI